MATNTTADGSLYSQEQHGILPKEVAMNGKKHYSRHHSRGLNSKLGGPCTVIVRAGPVAEAPASLPQACYTCRVFQCSECTHYEDRVESKEETDA